MLAQERQERQVLKALVVQMAPLEHLGKQRRERVLHLVLAHEKLAAAAEVLIVPVVLVAKVAMADIIVVVPHMLGIAEIVGHPADQPRGDHTAVLEAIAHNLELE